MNKYKDIFALWVKDELVKRGHKVFKTRRNVKNPNYKVYVFNNSIEFDNDLTEINRMKKFSAE